LSRTNFPAVRRHLKHFFLLPWMIGFLMSTPALAAPNKTLFGRVTAPSGSPIANARILIKGTAEGSDEESVTPDSDGSYTVTNLSPGIYLISVTAPGFEQSTTTVTLGDAEDLRADLVLQDSEAADGQGLQDAAQVGQGRSAQAVSDLPLNGRSATDVAALEPGVLRARTQASQGINGFGSQMAIFGGRPRQNGSRLDGISVSDYANGPLGNAVGVALGVDALERLSVLTRNDQAQFGRSSGGYISSGTRSGTNNFHGSAFEYYRNQILDAKDYFDLTRMPFRRHQFGASAGGPILRDRTYFFTAFEGIRESQGSSNVITTPSQAARDGILSDQTVTVDPAAKRILDGFYPLPNAGLLGAGDIGKYQTSGLSDKSGNHSTTRVDHKLSAADSLFAAYTFDAGSSTRPDRLNMKRLTNRSRQQIFRMGHTHTFSPAVLNSFRFGLYRMVASTGETSLADNPLSDDTSFGSVPGRNLARAHIPGLSMLGAGVGGADQYDFAFTSIQATNDISIVRGGHSIKFGVAIERMRDNIAATFTSTGEFAFNSLADFLTNQPNYFAVTLPGSQIGRSYRQTVFGTYIQDDWLIRPNFTLSMGLRYEMATVPTEVNGRLSVLRNLADTQPQVGGPLFNNFTLRNFEPRVGFAWDPFRNGRSVISSGFGIFDVLPLPYQIQVGELFAAPFYMTGNSTNLPAGSYPTEAYDIVLASPTGFNQAYFQPDPKRNYVMQWNLTTQWRLPTNVNMKVGYVGSRGVHHIFRVRDANFVLPELTSAGYLWPFPRGSGTRINPDAGRITAAFWNGDSYYNALVVNVQKRFGRGAQIIGSYTWGKSIDTSSGSMDGGEYSNALSSPLWFAPRLNRGQSDYDISQNVKITYSWQLPTPQWTSGVSAWALGGWQVGGIFEASTGVPFTPGFAGDSLGTQSTDNNMGIPDLVRGPDCQSLVNSGNFVSYINTSCFQVPRSTPEIADRCTHANMVDSGGAVVPDTGSCLNLLGNLGRNLLIGPGRMTLDFSLFKNNYIRRVSDVFNLQFRAEIFNIFNRANINAPLVNRDIFDSNGNRISGAGLTDRTQTSARNIQLALRLIW